MLLPLHEKIFVIFGFLWGAEHKIPPTPRGRRLIFKFGFVGALKIEIVGADVLDGPMPTREDSLSGKGYLRGVEDVAPYIWLT